MTFFKVGERLNIPLKGNLKGTISEEVGQPSIISYFFIVLN
jgi:hypothetical protein